MRINSWQMFKLAIAIGVLIWGVAASYGSILLVRYGEGVGAENIQSACTTTGEFQVGDTTIHCGVIRKEVLAETLERKRERLKEECSNYVRGIE